MCSFSDIQTTTSLRKLKEDKEEGVDACVERSDDHEGEEDVDETHTERRSIPWHGRGTRVAFKEWTLASRLQRLRKVDRFAKMRTRGKKLA